MKIITLIINICIFAFCIQTLEAQSNRKNQYHRNEFNFIQGYESLIKNIKSVAKNIHKEIFACNLAKNEYRFMQKQLRLFETNKKKETYLCAALQAFENYQEYAKNVERKINFINIDDENSLKEATIATANAYRLDLKKDDKKNKTEAIFYFKKLKNVFKIQNLEQDEMIKNYDLQEEVLEIKAETNNPNNANELDRNLLLKLVNEARAKGCKCGKKYYHSTKPLHWNKQLESAAYQHSKYMSISLNYSHTGKNNSLPWDRAKKEGYKSQYVGENIYWSQEGGNENEAIKAWLKSPGHCANLMNPAFKEMGLGRAKGYWTQVLGSNK